MLNHYTAVLQNEAFTGDLVDLRSPNFSPIDLPPAFRAAYQVLFGGSDKIARTYQLLNNLYGAGRTQFIKYFDPRVSWTVEDIQQYPTTNLKELIPPTHQERQVFRELIRQYPQPLCGDDDRLLVATTNLSYWWAAATNSYTVRTSLL